MSNAQPARETAPTQSDVPAPEGGEALPLHGSVDSVAAGAPAVQLAVVEAANAPLPELVEALDTWRNQLAAAGVACRAVALHGNDPRHCRPFPESLPELAARWQKQRSLVQPGAPFQVERPTLPGGDLLLATALQMPDGQPGAVGVALAPPHNDRTVQQVMLALGWLQLALAAPQLERAQRATRLLDLQGHVASQRRARSAAQEWINRTAVWARDEQPQPRTPFSLMLFELRGGRPHWWVSSDAAWAEKASPSVQAATEVAAQAAIEQLEVRLDHAFAVPLLDGGEPVAVLVALFDGAGAVRMPESMAALLRVSASLCEPLLRQWRLAERPLWRHGLDSLRDAWRKLIHPGHLTWKFGALGVLAALAILLAWPVPDRVTANTTIEGMHRLVVTAPIDGFVGQVLVRPGQRVKRGQLLAKLDDRDLKLEQARYRSEREQASGRLRQAMTDHEAPAIALALAEVQQTEAQLALVETKLARTGLTAQEDGLVVSGDWVQQIGSPVETGKEMFEIASGKGYRVVLQVPDRDIARVRAGQEGVLRLAGQPHSAHRFRVVNVTATAGVQDGVNAFRVEADWLGESPDLSPGMQGVGKIEVGRSNLLTLLTRPSLDWLVLKLWAWWW